MHNKVVARNLGGGEGGSSTNDAHRMTRRHHK